MALTTFQKSTSNNDVYNKFYDRSWTNGACIDTVETRNFYNDLNAIIKDNATLVMNGDVVGEGNIFNSKAYLRNLLLLTEEADHSAWGKNGVTVTANAINDPNGVLNGDKLVETATNAIHEIQIPVASVVAGVAYTLSVHAKSAERTLLSMAFLSTILGSNNCVFDLTTGVVSSQTGNVTPRISNVGNGWYCCSISGVATTSVFNNCGFVRPAITGGSSSYLGDGISGLYIWGAQLEKDTSYPTPYQKVIDGVVDFTYTRADSVATEVNEYGLVENACYNMLQYSEQLDNAAWAKFHTTITPNSTIAPNGTLTADSLIEDATLNAHEVDCGATTVVGTVYTLSVYMKKNGRDRVMVNPSTSGTIPWVIFDLNTGTAVFQNGTPTDKSISNVGNGWYRCSVTFVSDSASIRPAFYLIQSGSTFNYTGDGTSGVYLWGAQLVQGQNARPYLRTTDRQNVPRVDYSNGLPASRTNLLSRSEEFDNVYWTKQFCTITPNATTAPDGIITADKLIADTSTNVVHNVYVFTNCQANTDYTTSIYAKAGEYKYLYIQSSYNGFMTVHFDLLAGTITASNGGLIPTITLVGNGWYRCSIKGTTSSSSTNIQINYGTAPNGYTPGLGSAPIVGGAPGDGASGIYVWGTQFELGSIATDYIKTTTQPVTQLNYPVKTKGQLLLEPSRTNLLIGSEDINTWMDSVQHPDATLSLNTDIAPSGQPVADKMVANATNNHHQALGYLINTTASTAYTFSVYLKPAGCNWIRIMLGNAATTEYGYADVNLLTGAFGTNAVTGAYTGLSFKSWQMPNGWYRIALTVTTNTATQVRPSLWLKTVDGQAQWLGDGVSGAIIWGAQLEQGAYATSYIPTTTVAVTRAADTPLFVGLQSKAILSSSTGTLVAGINWNCTGIPNAVLLGLNITGTTDQLHIVFRNGNSLVLQYASGADSTSVAASVVGTAKVCFNWNGSIAKFFVNGVLIASSYTITPTAFDQFVYLTASQKNVSINHLSLYPTTLADAQCIELTT